jgi:hypothetical protein
MTSIFDVSGGKQLLGNKRLTELSKDAAALKSQT